MEYKNGNPIVKTKNDLNEAEKIGSIYVSAVCPKCGDDWTSLLFNASIILEKGCLCCVDEEEEWHPKIGVL